MESRHIVFALSLGFVIIAALVVAVPNPWFDPCSNGTLARETPQATFSFTYHESNGTMTITHTGGDTLYVGEEVSGESLPAAVVGIDHENGHERLLWAAGNGSGIATDDIRAGDSIVLANPGSSTHADATLNTSLSTGDTVRVIWINAGSSDVLHRRCKQTLDQATIPGPA